MTFARFVRIHQLERFATWQRTETSYPRAWRSAQINDEYVYWMTAEELDALGEQLSEILFPLVRERLSDPSVRPEGALPVELLVFGFPIEAPPADGE